MATAYIPLPPAAWYPTDDSSGSASAQLQKKVTSNATDPQMQWLEWLFDEATDEHIMCQFIMPGNYDTGLVLKVHYKMAATNASKKVGWAAAIYANTPADATDMDADLFAASDLTLVDASDNVCPDEAGIHALANITLTADNVAAGDYVCVLLYRDADNATEDDATGDAEFVGADLQYTAA